MLSPEVVEVAASTSKTCIEMCIAQLARYEQVTSSSSCNLGRSIRKGAVLAVHIHVELAVE